MNKVISIVLIIGFLAVDWLMFHDILKAGERQTVTECLTGALSVLVFYTAVRALMSRNR